MVEREFDVEAHPEFCDKADAEPRGLPCPFCSETFADDGSAAAAGRMAEHLAIHDAAMPVV